MDGWMKMNGLNERLGWERKKKKDAMLQTDAALTWDPGPQCPSPYA